MKKAIFMAAFALLAVACSNESELTVSNEKALVQVHVNDFSVVMEDMSPGGGSTRSAVSPDSYNALGAMTLAFYASDGTEMYKETQTKSDNSSYDTFGSFSCELPIGTYTMVAIGYAWYDGDAFTLTSPTSAAFTSERPRETFTKTQSVTVSGTTPLSLNVTLNRISSWLKIVSTDKRPTGVSKIRTTYAKGSKSFNPTTGLALDDNGFSQTNSPSAAVGATVNFSSCPFLTSADNEEELINITITVLDNNDNELLSKVVQNVPFMRNRMTILTGKVFTPSNTSASFQIETGWITEKNVNF